MINCNNVCENKKNVEKLSLESVSDFLKKFDDWNILEEKFVVKKFIFKGFMKTCAFLNTVNMIAHKEGHHPDILYGYNYCEIRYQTHSIEGISELDLKCIKKIESIL